MDSKTFHRPRLPVLVFSLLVVSSFCRPDKKIHPNNHTAAFRSENQLKKLKLIQADLNRINKLPVKTIQSPDGDFIDCVETHRQLAFDHPLLKGKKPLDPPERPYNQSHSGEVETEMFQLWSMSGESCPEGTVPIRRTTEEDMLRASSVQRFGRKASGDSPSKGHEYAVGFVSGGQYYGAQASMTVWKPRVNYPFEFSLSQIWLVSGTLPHDLNTIEAGWQVYPKMYGDNNTRFFTYWTSDAYQATGCYNLICPGFVQTNRRIAIGATIAPTSSYNGAQFSISLLVWKDPKHGDWWLEYGSGVVIGYWPAFLFTHLRSHATKTQFGGEVVNKRSWGFHTATEMGSGHFAGEGFRKAAYFRNMKVVNLDNRLIPLSDLEVWADNPNCYNIQPRNDRVWGNYFYYGGPGRNVNCP
ncbi:uncharacterized protein LOC111449872 [Cucurbita moschata]|uniref:Uncharacterized protein LOC111449872 n=1 Tax=Cucurbita moschata TaxID=3662 RepID=A0A6J1G1R1_CUCMO|nr:uncharacterized protein LOC111449872 [Cucurbita moschata]